MTKDEFRSIGAAMQARWWAFPFPKVAVAGYETDLADLPCELVRAAVDSFAADGEDRPPTSGQIRRRVAELELDAPSWDQVRTALVRWRAARPDREAVAESWECPTGECDGSGWLAAEGRERALRACSCRPARRAAMRGLELLPAMVAEFVTDSHVQAAELDRMLGEGDTTTEAQIRGRWREFVARAVESRAYAGLPGGGVARLESARDETLERGRRHGELRRFEVAGLLGAGERAA